MHQHQHATLSRCFTHAPNRPSVTYGSLLAQRNTGKNPNRRHVTCPRIGPPPRARRPQKKKNPKPAGARVPPPRPHSDARAIGQIPSSPPVPAVREGGPKTTHVRARRRPGGWPGRPTTSQARGRSYSSWPTVSSSESPPMREPWSARNLSAMAAWTAAPVGSTSSSIMKYGECPVCTDPSVSLRTPM